MTLLATISILCGFITSYYLVIIHSRQLALVAYHVPFRFWQPYLALYDRLECKYTYELLGGSMRFKSYRSFLNEYNALRPNVTNQFRSLWNRHTMQIGRNYGLVLIVALGLFWKVWWLFMLSFMLVQLASIVHLQFIKRQDTQIISNLMLSLLMAQSGVVKTTGDFIKRSEKLL